MSIRLWGRPTSARTQKVMLALAELELDYEYILASGTMGLEGSVAKGGKPFGIVDTPEYLEMNPTGKIPTINDNGYTLWESNAIVHYLGMKYNPELFYGRDVYICGSALRWMMWENNELIPPMHEVVEQTFRLPVKKRDQLLRKKAEKKLLEEFGVLERQLGKTKYITGDTWTMGDIPITIRCHRFHLLDISKIEMRNLWRYYELVKRRPSFDVVAEESLHIGG